MAMQADVESHTAAMRASVPTIVGELDRVLGQRLTAAIAGVSDAKAVAKWSRGERAPRRMPSSASETPTHITCLLLQAEAPSTIRAWFSGMNPELDDRAPALVLGDDAPRVLQAARTFLAHG